MTAENAIKFDALCFDRLSDAEEILQSVGEYVKKYQSGTLSDEENAITVWESALYAISRAGRSTWYRCKCGELSPQLGTIDAICPICGELRRLPRRLSRAPWPLYISCLKAMHGNGWFLWLSDALAHKGLGGMREESGGAGACSRRFIETIDGMKISESGEITGLSWIAIEMPL